MNPKIQEYQILFGISLLHLWIISIGFIKRFYYNVRTRTIIKFFLETARAQEITNMGLMFVVKWEQSCSSDSLLKNILTKDPASIQWIFGNEIPTAFN